MPTARSRIRPGLLPLGGLAALVGILVAAPAPTFAAAPTVLVVGTTTDDPALQSCSSSASSSCSLRGALEIARSHNSTAYTVEAPPNTYPILHGALGIASSVTLESTVAGRQVVLDGSNDDVDNGLLVINPRLAVCPPQTSCLDSQATYSIELRNVTIEHSTLQTQSGTAARATAVPDSTIRASGAAGIDIQFSDGGGFLDVSLTDVAVTDNTTNSGAAAGIEVGQGRATLNRVLVARNTNSSSSGAGGLDNELFDPANPTTIINSTFTANTGADAGAIEQNGNALFLAFDTIAGNSATNSGGAGALFDDDGQTDLTGVLVGGSSTLAKNGPVNCSNASDNASHGGNVDADGSCLSAGGTDKAGSSKELLDTRLSALAPNGGALPTMGLEGRSPAIGTANAPCTAVVGVSNRTNVTQDVTDDARAFPRPDLASSSGTKTTTCDAGAFEVQLASPDPGQFTKGPQPPPGGFTPEFPAGGFALPDPIPPAGASVTEVDPANTAVAVTLTVPQGALPGGTQVAFYHGVTATLTTQIPSDRSAVDGYAVAWEAPDRTRPDAAIALTITVADPSVPAGGTLYLCKGAATSACTTAAPGSTVSAGRWSASFTADPGFVLAQAAAAPPVSPPPTISAPPAGAAPAGPRPAPALVALIGGLTALGLAGRARRRGASGNADSVP